MQATHGLLTTLVTPKQFKPFGVGKWAISEGNAASDSTQRESPGREQMPGGTLSSTEHHCGSPADVEDIG